MPGLRAPNGTCLPPRPRAGAVTVERRNATALPRELRDGDAAVGRMQQHHEPGRRAATAVPHHPDLLHVAPSGVPGGILRRWCVEGGHSVLVVLLSSDERGAHALPGEAGLALAIAGVRRGEGRRCDQLSTYLV